MPDFPKGRFCWYECYSDDPAASQAFYSDLVGWGTEPWGPDGAYTMIKNGETTIGGYMQLTDEMKSMGAPPHWLSYVATPNADETAQQTTASGGKVLREPFDIPEVGQITVLSDPQGAVLCGFQPAGDTAGHDGPAATGEFSWHELMTTDYEGAFIFYSTLFGWEKGDAMNMGDAGMYQMFARGGMPIGGMFNKPPEVPVPAWLYYIKVPNVDDLVDKITGAGGQILNGPMDPPGGDRIVQCMDPQGAAFALHSTP